jgi:hypothetical protein
MCEFDRTDRTLTTMDDWVCDIFVNAQATFERDAQ